MNLMQRFTLCSQDARQGKEGENEALHIERMTGQLEQILMQELPAALFYRTINPLSLFLL